MLRFTGMRYWLPTVLFTFALLPSMACAGGGGKGGSQNAPQSARPAELAKRSGQELDLALAARLKATSVDADFDGIDFDKVLDSLRSKHNVNILANWPALEAAGIARNARVEVHLKQVTLATLLENILAMVGKETELGYSPLNGIVIVSTKEDLARRTVLRIYDVSDLLGSQYELRRFANTPILRLQLAGGETTGGAALHGGLGGQGGGGDVEGVHRACPPEGGGDGQDAGPAADVEHPAPGQVSQADPTVQVSGGVADHLRVDEAGQQPQRGGMAAGPEPGAGVDLHRQPGRRPVDR